MTAYPASITKALHQVMCTVGYVQKKGKNAFHNYRYAGEGDLLEVLRPAMVEAGLLLIPSVIDQSGIDEYGNTRVTVAYTLAHRDGDVWPDKVMAVGCGNDKNSKGGVGDKGAFKAITGANKYLLFKLFQIETGDDPEAAEDPAPIARQKAAQPPAPPPPATRPQPRKIGWPKANPVGTAEGWDAWRETYHAAIRGCVEPGEVYAWIDANADALAKLKAFDLQSAMDTSLEVNRQLEALKQVELRRAG